MSGSARSVGLCAVAGAALLSAGKSPAQTLSVSDSGDILETIVVTAQKRREDIQEVPESISVMSGKQLEDQHATQLVDYAGYIPGFQIQNGGTPGQSTLQLRGIAPLGSSATVATYIDDTPLGSSSLYGGATNTTLDLLPFDFQSFEVLKGPQGTLYGASALGGLIKYVTNAPDLEHFSVAVGGDTFNLDGADKWGVDGRIRLNVPLITDQLGMTVSFSKQNTPGYINSVETGARDQNSYSEQAGRAALLWQPVDALSVSVAAIQQRIEAAGTSYVAVDPQTYAALYSSTQDNNYVPETFSSIFNYFTASVNWNLGWADFHSATSYSQTNSVVGADTTLEYGVLLPLLGAPAGIAPFNSDTSLYKTTQEFRLTSKPDDRIEWLGGAFYTYENSGQSQFVGAESFAGVPIAGFNPLATYDLLSTYREYALFGDATYKFNPLFDLTGGLRWARNSQTYTQLSGGALIGAGDNAGTSAQDVVTYSVSPRVHITSDTMAYIRVASGYQPGGPNLYVAGVPPSVKADTVTNYEIGLKSLLAERRLQVDVDAFYIDWQKIQVGATNGVVGYLVNGGTAKSEGVEFAAEYTPLQGLRLGFNTAYTEAILTEDIPSIGGLSGDTLPYVPRWSGALTADYSIPLQNKWTASVGGGFRYTGARETEVTHSPEAFALNSYGVLDLNASISNEHWTGRLFVKNATNRMVYENEAPILNAATDAITQLRGIPLQPRTLGVGFDFKF
jgi:iron complex outermembrane recepter protein